MLGYYADGNEWSEAESIALVSSRLSGNDRLRHLPAIKELHPRLLPTVEIEINSQIFSCSSEGLILNGNALCPSIQNFLSFSNEEN
jgi:hypothetical protein